MGRQSGDKEPQPGCFACFARKPKKTKKAEPYAPRETEEQVHDANDTFLATRSEDSFYSIETRSRFSNSDLGSPTHSQVFDTGEPTSLALIISAKLERDDVTIAEIASIIQLYQQQQQVKAAIALHALCRKHSVLVTDISPAFVQAQPLLQGLMQLAHGIQDGLTDPNNRHEWNLVVNTDLKMYYRHLEATDVHSFKAVCTLEAEVEQPMALFREFDLVNSWAHMVTESLILKEISPHEVIVYAAVWMPWPFTPPELIIHATFLDLLATDNCYMVSLHSAAPEQLADVRMPPDSAKRVRLAIMPGSCVKLMPQLAKQQVAKGKGAQVSEVPQVASELTIHLCTNHAPMPAFVVQFVLKVLSPFLYKQVLKLLRKNFHSAQDVIPQRMAQRAEFYDEVRAAVRQHMAAPGG